MFPINYRDLELGLLDRGVSVGHTTIVRWIQAYAAELEKRSRPHLRMSNGPWQVDETYVKVKGRLNNILEQDHQGIKRLTGPGSALAAFVRRDEHLPASRQWR
jgi:transposase-like protein